MQKYYNDNWFSLQICKLKFPAKLKWLTHMRRSHDKRSDDDTLTPFLCDSCPKFFTVKKELLSHLKLDHSNKPFLFKQQNSLTSVAPIPTQTTVAASTVSWTQRIIERIKYARVSKQLEFADQKRRLRNILLALNSRL